MLIRQLGAILILRNRVPRLSVTGTERHVSTRIRLDIPCGSIIAAVR